MGQGRHALFLGRQGFDVLGVDRSQVAVDQVRELARGLPVQVQRLDVETEALPAGPFALVVVTNYLQRSLFGPLQDVLAPGGCLFYETFTEGCRPEYLLAPGELLRAFPRLTTVAFDEAGGRSSWLGRFEAI